MTRARKHYLLLIPAIAFAAALGAGGCGTKEGVPAAGPPEVRVAVAATKDVPVSREWLGQTLGAVDIEIRARVDGWLESIHFREGSEVRKGDLLYTIDPAELEQKVVQAKAKVAEAQTMFVRAESDANRYRPLAEAKAVSQRDLEAVLAEYGARQGEVEAARAALRLAEIELGYATITAPIDGLIGLSAARVGDLVGRPPSPVILNTVSRVDSVRVRFSITENEYLELARRLQATPDGPPARERFPLRLILSDGTRYPHVGSVSVGQREIDPATGTLQLEALYPNPERLLRPGQFARVVAEVGMRKDAVVVPARAVTELQGQQMLFTVGADNKVAVRRVAVGPSAGPFTVIDRGLAAGEKVIVEGQQRGRPDMPVRPVEIPADSLAGGGGR